MENVLTAFVDRMVEGGRGDVFRRADEVLVNIGYQNHYPGIDGVIASSDDLDTSEVVDAIHDVLTIALTQVISEYGIGISFEHRRDLGVLTQIVLGLHELVGFSDTEAILAITEAADSPEEILAETLEIVVGGDRYDYYRCLSYVTPSLVGRIEAIVKQNVQTEAMDEETDRYLSERADSLHEQAPSVGEHTRAIVKVFLQRHPTPEFIELIRSGWQLGYGIDKYLDALLTGDEYKVAEIAKRYMVSSLASGVSLEASAQRASSVLESRIDDVVLLQDVIRHIRSFLTEVSHG